MPTGGFRWVPLCGGIALSACPGPAADEPVLHSSIAMTNMTHGDIEVQLVRPEKTLDCATIASDPEGRLEAEDFSSTACVSLHPFEFEPLDLDWTSETDYDTGHVPPPDSARPCDAVLLRARGLEDAVLFWNDIPKVDFVAEDGHIPRAHESLLYFWNVGERLIPEYPPVVTHFFPAFDLGDKLCTRPP